MFPRFDDFVTLSAANVLRSIIRQSLQPDDVTGEVERQLSRFGTSDADMDIIESLFQHCISLYSTLYIVIDAMDEFEKEERNILLRCLSSFVLAPVSKVKLFLVGRSGILTDFRKWFQTSYEKSADCGEVQADIEAYTREIVTHRRTELDLQDPTLAQGIIEALIDGANGMCVSTLQRLFNSADPNRFLWVDFQITEICQCTCDNEVREALLTLPKSLGETFNRAMKRIVKDGRAKIVSHIFQWVAASKRALTLDELRDALSYEPGKPYSVAGNRPNGLEHVATWCENLVQLDEELQIVQLTHHSVLQHFLERPSDSSLHKFHIELDEADHHIGEICVTYLDSSDFKTDLIRNPTSLPNRLPKYIIETTLKGKGVPSRIVQKLNASSYRKPTNNKEGMVLIKKKFEDPTATVQLGHPFLKYALDYWLLHTRNFEQGKSRTWNMWKQMIRGEHALATIPWSAADFDDSFSSACNWFDKHDHLAIFTQVVSTAKISPEMGVNLICRYAELGRLKYTNILTNLSENKQQLENGLRHAAANGLWKAVECFLDAKADVNGVDQRNG